MTRASTLPAVRQSRDLEAGIETSVPMRALDLLFVMRSSDSLRFYQSTLELLVERGHNVRVLTTRAGAGRGEHAWLERMADRPNFAHETVDHLHGGPWYKRGVLLRRGMEYVRFLAPGYETSSIYVRTRTSRAPDGFRRLAARPLVRTRVGLRLLYRLLCVIERALPMPPAPAEYLEELRPDLLALCDYMTVGSLLPAYARAARKLGIPVASCVVSWDNLSSAQQLRVMPDALIVWNELQLQEAGEIHRVPAERVVVTGAPSFDKWFAWEPRERREFMTRVGLDPDRPYIVWIGSTPYAARRTEAQYVAAWLRRLRAADPTLREAGVLLRPHPYRFDEWLEADFSGLENVALWPRRGMQMPVGREQRADFYDSMFHSAAVIGLNTSAMIEAAIIGRPVLTILEPEFHQSQLGTFHFRYLLESSGEMLRVANSPEENFDQLRAILAGEDAEAAAQAREFVARFVRPQGLGRPSTPIFVEALEQLAQTPVRPTRDPVRVLAVRGTIVAGYRIQRVYARVCRRVRKRLKTAYRVSKRHLRRFFLVWLRAAVRSRLQRLRRLAGPRRAAAAGESRAPDHNDRTEPR